MTSLLEILLFAVIVATAYTGPVLLRRLPPGRRAFPAMVLADLVLAVLALAVRSEGDEQTAELIGVIAIGGAVCLLIVPGVLKGVTRRALAADRLKLAKALIDFREVLQPKMGAKEEGEFVATILAVRGGRVDEALTHLAAQKRDVRDPVSRRRIAERIIMTLLYARRWSNAIDAYETTFRTDASAISPQLLVEMVRAYGEVDNLDAAATIISRLEASPLSREPILAGLMFRARLVFLAFVGRTTAVERLLNGPMLSMPDAARHYWEGVARLNAGDRGGARMALRRAKDHSTRDERAREVAQMALARLDDMELNGPRTVSPSVADVADRLISAISAMDTGKESNLGRKKPKTWVTHGFIAANLVVAVLMSWIYGSTADIGGLVRSGANVKAAVAAGEWWRLPTSMFLHVGMLHLFLNMYGLWILGRLVEPMYGWLRFFAVYMSGGLVGALASVVVGGPATSAGASGAVFGILGAAIAELGLRKHAYPALWRKRLLANLLFLTAANVGIGFVITLIDQAAHLGGLLGGAAVAAMISPKAKTRFPTLRRTMSRLLAAISVAALVYGAFGVATTSYEDTLAAQASVERTVGGLRLQVPATWEPADDKRGLQDSSLPMLFYLTRAPGGPPVDAVIKERIDAEVNGGARALGFDRVAVANEPMFSLPEPWRATELIANVDADGFGGKQRFRAAVFAREANGELWFGLTYLPASMATPIGRRIAEVLASAEAVGPIPPSPAAAPSDGDDAAQSAEAPEHPVRP